MLLDWLAAAFLCECFSSYFAMSLSVAVLWFALPAVGFAPLPAVGFAPLPAVGFAPLGSLHHCSRSAMFFSCSPRTLVALLHSLHHWLVGCVSVSDSHHWLLGCGSVSDSPLCGSLRLRGSFQASTNITTQHCATS